MVVDSRPVSIGVDLTVGESKYAYQSVIDSNLLRDENIRRSVVERMSSDFEEKLERLLLSESARCQDSDGEGHEQITETDE